MSDEKLEKLYAFLTTRSPIMDEIIACSKEFNEEEINYLETSTNEENTNTILEFLIKNGIGYTLDLDTDDFDKTNVQTQIQIDLKIDGLPNFAFFYNAKTDDAIYYRTVLTINEKVLDDSFASWKKEFEPNDIFSDLIKGDGDNTVHFYGEVPQKDFSEEKLKAIIDYLKTRSSFMDKIISLSEDVKRKNELPIKLKALRLACEKGEISCVMLQKELSIGYELASDLCEWLEDNGYVSHANEQYKRKTLITKQEFETLVKECE